MDDQPADIAAAQFAIFDQRYKKLKNDFLIETVSKTIRNKQALKKTRMLPTKHMHEEKCLRKMHW